VESFRYPLDEHCSVPLSEAYAVTSTMILFKYASANLQLAPDENLSRLWLLVVAEFWHSIAGILALHCSTIWLSSCLWFTQLLGAAPVSTLMNLSDPIS
jgi:hypothetical protein